MTNEHLKQFEEMNTTTDSIYDLGDFQVLIILKDGTNLTSWQDVKNEDDILYVSEDLSNETDLSNTYADLKKVNVIIVSGITNNVKNMGNMFHGCYSLKIIKFLDHVDVSNVMDMNGLFNGCFSISDFSFLSSWNVSNVTNMSNMFHLVKV